MLTQPPLSLRACAGKDLALSTMWITIASVLAAFSIKNGVTETGKPIEPQVEYLPGTVRSVSTISWTQSLEKWTITHIMNYLGTRPHLESR
jgi:hypothetical protein